MENWKDSDINVDSLWLFNERDKSGKHANVYHGNFIPQVPRQLIKRYTQERDLVLEFFAGSGTTLYECESLTRDYIGFDINPLMISYIEQNMANSCASYRLYQCDVTSPKVIELIQEGMAQLGHQAVDFFIAHPPYLDIIKFTDLPEDLSQISDIKSFIEKIIIAIGHGLYSLKRNKYFAIVMGDLYRDSEVVPLGFYVMQAIQHHYRVKLKGIVTKNIEGNRGKLNAQNIWRYRALKSDYFLFKHEYIFVFKKL